MLAAAAALALVAVAAGQVRQEKAVTALPAWRAPRSGPSGRPPRPERGERGGGPRARAHAAGARGWGGAFLARNLPLLTPRPFSLPPSPPLFLQDQPFDCAKGCTLSTALVCGEDGLTYMGACLAACGPAKVGVAHEGACGPPSAAGGRSSQAFGDDLAHHPVASMFDMAAVDADAPAGNADGAPTFKVTEADLARFQADGLALVGVGRVAAYDIPAAGAAAAAAKQAALNGGAANGDAPPASKKAKGVEAEAAVIEPRVLALAADTGLLYASSAPFTGTTARGSAAVSPGSPGPDGGGSLAAEQEEADAADAARVPSAEGMSPDFQPERWIEMTSKQPYPYRQHVWLDSGCSGTIIGPHVVGSAAHCVYSQASRSFYPLYTTRPAAFRTDNGWGPVQSPYGAFPASRVLVLSGWTQNDVAGGGHSVWFFDASAIVHAGEVAKETGYAGFGYFPSGVAGVSLMTAGYPQTTQSRGRFMRYRSPCPGSDANGDDSEILVGVANCAVAEGGQSGSGIWDASNHVLHGVLSRGTDEYDIWYELTPMAYDFWSAHKGLTA